MTTYTITQAQRQTLLDVADRAFNESMHELLSGLPVAAPSTRPEVDMSTEAEVAMDAFNRITEQTVRGDQLQTLAIDYAVLCGELSKGLSPLDKEWIDLRDLGERLDALAAHDIEGGA